LRKALRIEIDNAPSFSEILIILGVLAARVLVVTLFISPALVILSRYKEELQQPEADVL
jgi:hypothetical protein